jgi:hypothetical protein
MICEKYAESCYASPSEACSMELLTVRKETLVRAERGADEAIL